ncbi:threonine synthase [Rhizobiales bacterium GAS188]|nr:threonine synthase [Rhizobiales bacterium GAS188]
MRFSGFACVRCGAEFPTGLRIDSNGCPSCFDVAPSNVRVIYAAGEEGVSGTAPSAHRLSSLWRYADALPCAAENAVSLGEGGTPLISIGRIGTQLGLPNLFIKDESRNPTWSHKDRFSTVAVSMARLAGANVLATASSGNGGASLAAYAARAGLRCVVVTFASAAGPMMAQVRAYGATVLSMAQKLERWPVIAHGVEKFGWFPASPFNAPVVGSHPLGIEGYKTLAYEIVDQLVGIAPDWCVMPVCYGDALAGLWYGFRELFDRGRIRHLPRLAAAEAHGSLQRALASDSDRIPDVRAKFDSLAVSIGTTRSAFQALQALRQSNGVAVPIDNRGLAVLQRQLASTEGLFPEVTSVTPLAAVRALRNRGVMRESDRVVIVTTAGGLKDVVAAGASVEGPIFQSADEAIAQLGAFKTSTSSSLT